MRKGVRYRESLRGSAAPCFHIAPTGLPLSYYMEHEVALTFDSRRYLLTRVMLLGLCVFFAGCGARRASDTPWIEFTKVPLVGEGGPDKLDKIEGRVLGARPGQRIVLFARWGPWWVQPLADQPFTIIRSDSKWTSTTHFGTEYAALLVEPGYRPPATIDLLPSPGAGVIFVAITRGRAVFWQTGWFLLGTAAVFVFVGVMLFRVRMRAITGQLSLRLEERLAERTRIAQDLHDTLLQNFLSISMQLHVFNEQLTSGSSAKSAMLHVLDMMARVIEEGRNTVQGLRSSNWRSRDLEHAFSRIQDELAITEGAHFRVIAEGVPRALRPVVGDDIYLIGREALANAFHHAEASEIEAQIEYAARELRLLVRDNGRGLSGSALHSDRAGQHGVPGMRERAERIGGKLRILSRAAAGTEVELRVPGHIAYFPRESDRPMRWFSRLHPRDAKAAKAAMESEQV